VCEFLTQIVIISRKACHPLFEEKIAYILAIEVTDVKPKDTVCNNATELEFRCNKNLPIARANR
jgi:hypothetical protein